MASKKQGPEQIVQNAILEWLSHQDDCMFWRNNSVGVFDPRKRIFRKPSLKYSIKGVSDILGIWKGRPLAIEVKSKTGRPSPDQIEFINKFKDKGGIAFIARSIEDCEKALHEQETNSLLLSP